MHIILWTSKGVKNVKEFQIKKLSNSCTLKIKKSKMLSNLKQPLGKQVRRNLK